MTVEYSTAGAAVVCFREDDVLLIRRMREPAVGTWSLPGGKIHRGEPAREAALRELREETGVDAEVLDVIDVFDAIFPHHHYTVADFLAEAKPGQDPQPADDALEARWFSPADLAAVELTTEARRVIERARWLRRNRLLAPASLGLDPPDRLRAQQLLHGIYLITAAPPGRPDRHLELARAALEGGVKLIQLRDKQHDAGILLPVAREISRLCRLQGALFIINDRVDLALATGASAVHLGATDLPLAAARELCGPAMLLGASPETPDQARAAADAGADYLGAGPVWATATKSDAGPAVGLEHLSQICGSSALPCFAIGGVTLEGLGAVRRAGACGAAVVGAVAQASDPVQACRDLVREWNAVSDAPGSQAWTKRV